MIGAHEKPLAGKRIVVTRAPRTGRRIDPHARALGRRIILAADRGIRGAGRFAATRPCASSTRLVSIGFYSPVRMRYDSSPASWNSSAFLATDSPQVAAVGPATDEAAKLKDSTWIIWRRITPAHSLAHEMRERLAGGNVLPPSQRSRRQSSRRGAARRWALVTDVIAYRTVAPEAPRSRPCSTAFEPRKLT